jgi:hypothetical protein
MTSEEYERLLAEMKAEGEKRQQMTRESSGQTIAPISDYDLEVARRQNRSAGQAFKEKMATAPEFFSRAAQHLPRMPAKLAQDLAPIAGDPEGFARRVADSGIEQKERVNEVGLGEYIEEILQTAADRIAEIRSSPEALTELSTLVPVRMATKELMRNTQADERALAGSALSTAITYDHTPSDLPYWESIGEEYKNAAAKYTEAKKRARGADRVTAPLFKGMDRVDEWFDEGEEKQKSAVKKSKNASSLRK